MNFRRRACSACHYGATRLALDPSSRALPTHSRVRSSRSTPTADAARLERLHYRLSNVATEETARRRRPRPSRRTGTRRSRKLGIHVLGQGARLSCSTAEPEGDRWLPEKPTLSDVPPFFYFTRRRRRRRGLRSLRQGSYTGSQASFPAQQLAPLANRRGRHLLEPRASVRD